MTTRTRNASARPASGHPLFAFAEALARRADARLRRRNLTRLRDLDDHLLDDIGLTRTDVEEIVRMPLSVDGALELRRRSLDRRNAWFK